MSQRPATVPVDVHNTTFNVFGLGSATVGRALVFFGGTYVFVLAGACREIRSVAVWMALAGAFILFAVSATVLMKSGGPRLDRSAAAIVAAATVTGATLSFWSLPLGTYLTLQTTPPASAMTVVLALLVLHGRPTSAWLGAVSATGLAAVGGVVTGIGPAVGAGNTMFCYPVLAVATLFSIMMTPMPERIMALREDAIQQAASEAASRAAAAEREAQMRQLDARARTILQRIVDGHEFTAEETAEARLTEAQLRDAIRASAWSSDDVETAVWAARQQGHTIRLLDDGALDGLDSRTVSTVRSALLRELELLSVTSGEPARGTLTARVLPVGREVLATVVVGRGPSSRRVEIDATSAVRVVIDPGEGT